MGSQRKIYLSFSYLVAGLGGLSRGLHRSGTTNTDLVLALMMGLALALLVLADAKAVGHSLPASAGWLIFIFWPVAAPVAAIAARRRSGVGLVFVNSALIIVTYVAFGGLGLWLSA